MIEVTFHKARIQELRRAFRGHKPVTPSPGEWTDDELLQLAGAAMARVLERQAMSQYGKRLAHPVHREHAEAEQEQIYRDVWAGAYLIGSLAGLMIAGQYDRLYEPRVVCRVVGPDGYALEGEVIEGLKQQPPDAKT